MQMIHFHGHAKGIEGSQGKAGHRRNFQCSPLATPEFPLGATGERGPGERTLILSRKSKPFQTRRHKHNPSTQGMLSKNRAPVGRPATLPAHTEKSYVTIIFQSSPVEERTTRGWNTIIPGFNHCSWVVHPLGRAPRVRARR